MQDVCKITFKEWHFEECKRNHHEYLYPYFYANRNLVDYFEKIIKSYTVEEQERKERVKAMKEQLETLLCDGQVSNKDEELTH